MRTTILDGTILGNQEKAHEYLKEMLELPELWKLHPVASSFCPSQFNYKLAETYTGFGYEERFMKNSQTERYKTSLNNCMDFEYYVLIEVYANKKAKPNTPTMI